MKGLVAGSIAAAIGVTGVGVLATASTESAPPKPAAFALNVSNLTGAAVTPELYGHDLEFTRHDMYVRT